MLFDYLKIAEFRSQFPEVKYHYGKCPRWVTSPDLPHPTRILIQVQLSGYMFFQVRYSKKYAWRENVTMSVSKNVGDKLSILVTGLRLSIREIISISQTEGCRFQTRRYFIGNS